MTHSFDEQYWDGIWRGDRAASMGTSEVNPHLTAQVGGLTPGTALDAGCGAGAEAIWLARHGWQVTGADIAEQALARAAERAAAAGVGERVRWERADLSTWQPDTRFDLVTTHYAHPAMPQLEFYDRIADWVAPAGTLLIVGHLHPDNHGASATQSPGHRHGHGHGDGHGHQPPAEATATAAAIVELLDPAMWEIVLAEESTRTLPGKNGPGSVIHDAVVVARLRS